MTRVLRYPFEAITDDTDYLQVTIKEYPKPGLLTGTNSGYAINDDDSSSRGYNSPVQLVEDGVILLPMPVNINDRNQVGYGPDKLTSISAAVGKGVVDFVDETGISVSKLGTDIPGEEGKKYGIGNLTTDIGNSIGAIGTKIADTNASSFKEVGNTITRELSARAASIIPGVNITGTQILSRESGAILNPNMTLLMNGPSLRSFNFQFKMTPRDDREAKQVKSIIRSLKKNMSPRVDAGGSGSFLSTPNVFEIAYRKGGKNHPFLHKFKQCALKDLSVNYTGENVYATYDDGTPVSTIMTLSFQELVPIYDKDYNDRASDGSYTNNFNQSQLQYSEGGQTEGVGY